jgi:hypothetical protein
MNGSAAHNRSSFSASAATTSRPHWASPSARNGRTGTVSAG